MRLVITIIFILLSAYLPISTYAQQCSLMSVVGEKSEAILLHPDQVESYLLENMRTPRAMPLLEDTRYPIKEKGPLLSSSQLEMIRSILAKPRNYRQEVQKDCQFRPGVGLIFRREGKKYYALFCFGCNEWALENPQRQMIYSNFEGDTESLRKLAQELFPDHASAFNKNP